jgi:hypothetical protein
VVVFPGAVGAKEREHLSPRDMQVYTPDGLKRAIPHLQARNSITVSALPPERAPARPGLAVIAAAQPIPTSQMLT